MTTRTAEISPIIEIPLIVKHVRVVGFLLLLLIPLAIAIVGLALSPIARAVDPPPENLSPDTSINPSTVSYKIVNGRGSRLWDIVIPPKFATEAGLIAVAKRLDKDTADLPVIGVEIYDNAKAEWLISMGNIDDSNAAFCERHELASYDRNLNANINRLRAL